jgi:hypothetical protein
MPKSCPDTGNRIQQAKAVGVVCFGMTQNLQLDFIQQIVVETNLLQIEGDIGTARWDR